MHKAWKWGFMVFSSAIVMLCGMATAHPAAANYPDISLSVNGNLVETTPSVQSKTGLTAVPFRSVAESLGMTVYWNPATQAMTVVRGSAAVTVETGNRWASANGKAIQLAFSPYLYGERLYVPLTLFKQVFGADLGWDGVSHIASIRTADGRFYPGAGVKKVSIPDYGPLKQQIQNYLNTRPGQVNLFVQDVTTGAKMDIGGDEIHRTASTHKVPTVMYLYRLAAQGKVDLDAKLTYTSQYYRQGTGILQTKPYGGQYTLRELGRLSIVYSDNVAWAMLLDYLGRDNVNTFMRSLGGNVTGSDAKGYFITTPRDMGKYLGALLLFRDAQPQLGGEIFHAMENTIFNDRIPAKLPTGTVVAHKIGSLDDSIHDVGIIFANNRPFILSIYSKNGWEAASTDTLAQVSKMIYDYQVSLPQ
ncbi:serine hydrolase [Heliobacterium gestii]|uniref:Serine hydrolase n=1 Tax=Heliomicrobium gestii TaxID=2699 RepID=A0A845LHV8_HELGE|nr:serine hydrolase [Heliomicrobium gestii]MBM7868346.1 beta-lactamase class A [Heliomicrobium gestii]MZP42446.1 serine hydrolase [Heliomicrobium gestii]